MAVTGVVGRAGRRACGAPLGDRLALEEVEQEGGAAAPLGRLAAHVEEDGLRLGGRADLAERERALLAAGAVLALQELQHHAAGLRLVGGGPSAQSAFAMAILSDGS